MGELRPGDRLVFDFEGSLELAATMFRVAAALEAAGSSRKLRWDKALDAWQGNVGDRMRGFRDDDQTDLQRTVDVLREEAGQWAKLWADSVNETNRVLKAEVEDELRRTRKNSDKGFQWHDFDDPFDGGEKKLPVAPGVSDVPPPSAERFVPSRRPFVRYAIFGDEIEIVGFTHYPPPPGVC